MSNARDALTDPAALAREVSAAPRTRLLVFDCDGVLAPLVPHADDAQLAPGTGAALSQLARTTDTTVAVLSGRSLAGLEQFGFGDELEVVGSYGAERRGRPGSELDAGRASVLGELATLAQEAADGAGAGAWVEHKPASVVLHVREADPTAGAMALRRARDAAQRLHGVYVHAGKAVVELAVHPSDKGTALDQLIDEFEPASVLYVGDDEPDEAAFRTVEHRPLPGFGVRVGARANTAASHAIADPAAVTVMLRTLVELG